MARNMGSSYGTDIVVDTESPDFEAVKASGIASFGGGLTTFGSGEDALDAMLTSGNGLTVFGSGIMTMGSGLPLGMGLLSKLRGFAKKTRSIIQGAIPAQLRRAAVDFSKKKARELLPVIVSRVKTEIAEEAPGLAARLTNPLLKKVPDRFENEISGYVKRGTRSGIAALNKGIDAAEAAALSKLQGGAIRSMKKLGVADMIPLPVSSSHYTEFSGPQLNFMRTQGEDLQRQRDAGNVPKRLVLDQHSRSLLDQIMADKGYDKTKQEDMREQLGMLARPSNPDRVGTRGLAAATKLPAKPAAKKRPGRPKGSALRAKGVVNL